MKNRFIGLALLALLSLSGWAQKLTTVDIVKIQSQYAKEAAYFYEANWKAFRVEALKQKHISGYELLRTAPDSTGHAYFILLTEYPDSLTYGRREENFAPIMKRISPNGPRMLNDVPRSKFLEYVTGYDAVRVLSSRN